MRAARLELLALALSLAAGFAWAERVQVPMSLDTQVLESLLRERVFSASGDRLRLNEDGSGCQFLELREPHVSTAEGRVFVRTKAHARAGRAVAGQCLLVLDWRGDIELDQRPELDAGAETLVLRTVGWRALRPDGSVDTLSTTVGRWIEQFLPAELRSTRVSFAEPMSQLRDVLGRMLAASLVGDSGVRLDSLAVDAVAAGDAGVTVTLGLDTIPVTAPPPSAEPMLTPSELARLERQLEAVDAFFTYAIRSIGGKITDPVSADLLTVLVELRRDLVSVLREPARHSDVPVRRLFISAWEGLAPVLRGVAAQQGDHADALRYLTFIGAGDALRALDDLGPAVGIDISSDGLRRLARILVPGDAEDPLESTDAVDAELRRSLGFGAPLPPPQHYDSSSAIDVWLGALIPRAIADAGLDPAVAKKLNNWVPQRADMDEYLPMVRQVLRHVVGEQLRGSELDARYRELFRWLVFAAAWQESCWRQFEAKNRMRVPMESGSGDLGVMQINPTVWRGLYDLHGLRWDIVYNTRAGADILEHYLIDYALRHREHEITGSVDSLARATYAAYNGGPRQYARYRRGASRADALFYEKYRQVQKKELAVTACYGG